MNSVVYSCLIEHLSEELGDFTHEIFSTDCSLYRDDYFETRRLLRSLALVCHDWSYLARKTLQRRIIIRSDRGLRSFSTNCDIGPWIKEFYLEPTSTIPFEEEYDVSDSDSTEYTAGSDSEISGYGSDQNSVSDVEDDWRNYTRFCKSVNFFSQNLAPRLGNLRCLGINIRYLYYQFEYSEMHGFLRALQHIPALEGLFIVGAGEEGDESDEILDEFILCLCNTISELSHLTHLWVSGLNCTESLLTNIPEEVQNLQPPPRLRSVGFDVPNSHLPFHTLLWPRYGHPQTLTQLVISTSCIDYSGNNLDEFMRAINHSSTIVRLHLEFTVAENSVEVRNLLTSLLPILTSLRELHIAYETVDHLRAFPPNLKHLRLEFHSMPHFLSVCQGEQSWGICSAIRFGSLPHLERMTFIIPRGFEALDAVAFRHFSQYSMAAIIHAETGIIPCFEDVGLAAKKRLLADSFGCPGRL